MGNTLRAHDDLVHVRGWTSAQIRSVVDTLRRKRSVYSLTREEFIRYFGGRNREVVTVFGDLDTNFDGKVDIFEVLVVLIIWSGTSFDEKLASLFDLFDMMGKGFLKVDEVMLMASVIVAAMRKFVRIEPRLSDRAALKEFATQAMPPHEGQVGLDHFKVWARGSSILNQLKGFVEDHSLRGQENSQTCRMRLQIGAIEKHAQRLFDRVRQLQDRLPDFTDACIAYVSAWGRRKRWDFLMQNMRHLVLKLQRISESMHTTLAELEASLNEDEVSGGMAAVIDPHKRFGQEQMILDLDRMRQLSQADFREATELLKRLIDLTEPNEMQASMSATHTGGDLNAIAEDEAESLLDMSPPRVVDNRNLMKQVHSEMVSDTESGGFFAQTAAERVASQLQDYQSQKASVQSPTTRELATMETQPEGRPRTAEAALVCIADFDPPPSHQTQMLKLTVGDVVTIIGQDGRGWWYGRKQTGKEGWFPPSYVQTEPAHFSSVEN